jgi:PAS domain S-box-containing protein
MAVRQHFYSEAGASAPPSVTSRAQFSWVVQQSLSRQIIKWSRMPEDIPASAVSERQYAVESGAKSLLSIPVSTDSVLCIVTFVSLRRYRDWPPALVNRLRLAAGVLAGAVGRERTASELIATQERFRGAFEHSAIGIALVGLDGRWLKTNAAVSRMLGYTESELQTINFQVLTHPDDLEPDLQLLQQALRGEREHYEMEKRYLHKDGRTIPAFLTVSVVRDEERRPLYFVSQVQDLSEREKAQIENERLRIELNHFGRLAVIGQLTASLAHEVSQPIAAARANAVACQRLLPSTDPSMSDIHEGLRDIARNCTRAAEVVSQVRRLLRKELKPRKPVDLNRLVREVSAVTRHEFLLRKVHLVLKLQPQLPCIMGNSTELRQVILNLLLNGAEAVQHSKKRRVVFLESIERQDYVELAVHDSGTGIEPAALAKMFEPFYTTKPEGMGMGLTICADIVRSHQGRMCPELNETGGLTMRCLFPRAESG